jgi:hypothetical protein
MNLSNGINKIKKIEINKIIALGFFLRLSISFYNNFYTLPMASADAISFHQSAILKLSNLSFLENIMDGWIYTSFLALLYYFLTPSILIASISSCILWLLSSVVLNKIFNLLEVSHTNKLIAFAVYIFMPSSIIFTSIPLRESMELLIINLYIMYVILIIQNNKLIFFPILILLSALLFMLHSALILFTFFTSIFLLVVLSMKVINYFYKKELLFLYFFYTFFTLFSLAIIFLHVLDILPINIIFEFLQVKISNYHMNVPISRTTYLYTVLVDNFFVYLFNSLYFYFFYPMPYYIQNFYDFIYFVENIIRIGLLGFIVNNFFYLRKKNSILIIVLLIYIILEMMWAIGTANWGTAARHHVVSYGLLVILAFFNNFVKIINEIKKNFIYS